MTPKNAVSDIPAGGQKSVVITPLGIPSEERRSKILADHMKIVVAEHPGAIFGPDMNNPEIILDTISRTHPTLLRHLAGLSESCNGLSIDGRGYTAIGLAHAIRVWERESGIRLRTATIQGFGAVGAHVANILHEQGVAVRSIANQHGCATAKNLRGIDVPAMHAAWMSRGDDGVRERAVSESRSVLWTQDPQDVFQVESDIVLFAAGTSCFGVASELENLKEENPSVGDVDELHRKTGLKLAVEGANHPLSNAAEEQLEIRGVGVLPDFIANCGGVIGCWAEWAARSRSERVDQQTDAAARRHIEKVVGDNVREITQSYLPARRAAQRIVETKLSSSV